VTAGQRRLAVSHSKNAKIAVSESPSSDSNLRLPNGIDRRLTTGRSHFLLRWMKRLCQYYGMSERRFTAIYEEAEEGGYIGYVAELPGANTQGETLEETRANLKEAVTLLLECYREDADERFDKAVNATREELILQAA
jgi:predicted RNase H-like HicB family nuclease